MSQLRVSSIATTAGVTNISLSSNGIGIDSKPIISGQVGSIGSISGAQKIGFDEFWVQRGITYSSATKRFTVPAAGVYRITLNAFMLNGQAGTRLMIGINNDAPDNVNHRGHVYGGDANYQILNLDSVVSLAANDYIVYYIYAGGIYNGSSDRFNQFSIERIA
jgi:hypothetical protein